MEKKLNAKAGVVGVTPIAPLKPSVEKDAPKVEPPDNPTVETKASVEVQQPKKTV